MFHLAKALFCLYVVVRFFYPLPWPRWVKLVIGITLMIVMQHSFISLVVFGTMFSPEVPRAVLIVANALSGMIILLGVAQLVIDILILAISALRRRRVFVPGPLRYVVGIVALGAWLLWRQPGHSGAAGEEHRHRDPQPACGI